LTFNIQKKDNYIKCINVSPVNSESSQNGRMDWLEIVHWVQVRLVNPAFPTRCRAMREREREREREGSAKINSGEKAV
jgi:hypothetical protein